jgi:hypothetical protein
MRAVVLLVVLAAFAVGAANNVPDLTQNLASQRGYELVEDQTSSPTGLTTEEPGEHHEVHRYPVASVEFARVETPFIIGLWIFCASLAKIGQFNQLMCYFVLFFFLVPFWY